MRTYRLNAATSPSRSVCLLLTVVILLLAGKASGQAVDNFPFNFADNGGVSIQITDGGGVIKVGHVKIQPDATGLTPAANEIFSFRVNGVLISETVIPASVPVTSGRLYAINAGSINAGVIFANPNNQAATVSFFFTDANGVDMGAGAMLISANGQVARFFSEFPGVGTAKTFTFASNVPVAVAGLHGFSNEGGGFLITGLPVTDLSAPGNSALPHWVDGGGWATRTVLKNPTDNTLTGNVQFIGPSGAVTLTVNGVTSDTFTYLIPRRSLIEFVTAGTSANTQAGFVRVTPSGGSAEPVGFNLVSFKPAGITTSISAFLPIPAGTAFRSYVEHSGSFNPGDVQSGLILTNTSSDPVTVSLELRDLNGTVVGSAFKMVPGNLETAVFLSELFPNLPTALLGVLRIATASPGLMVNPLRLRINDRGDSLLSSIPAVAEDTIGVTAEGIIPQVVAGGGYASQIALFDRSPGLSSTSGVLRFLSQTGQPLPLSIAPSTTPVTVNTSPAGLGFTVDGVSYNSPQTFQWIPGSVHTIGADSPQAGGAGTRFVFTDWSDGGAQSHNVTAPSYAVTYTANFKTQHLLTTNSSPGIGGTIAATPSSADGYYDAGTPVQLAAAANAGYAFVDWSGDLSGADNPQNVTMSGPRSVTANFVALSNITVDSSPSGLIIVVDGRNYTAPQVFQWLSGSLHTIGTRSPQTGGAGTRFVFANWSDGGAISHSVTTPSPGVTYTAHFTTQYRLITRVDPFIGGTVSPSLSSFHDSGQAVTVSAVPNPGYEFESWTGPVSSPNSATTSISMTGPITVTANFTSAVQLVTTVMLTRLVDGSYQASVVIVNNGGGEAENVRLNTLRLNLISGSPLPQDLGTIGPHGGSTMAIVTVPASAGGSGEPVLVRYSGTYTGGVFSDLFRTTLPN